MLTGAQNAVVTAEKVKNATTSPERFDARTKPKSEKHRNEKPAAIAKDPRRLSTFAFATRFCTFRFGFSAASLVLALLALAGPARAGSL
jgi:hypothetical protein